jgi:hypothetical protein
MAGSQALFARKCTLQVTDLAGNGLDLSEFRIVFHVEAHDAEHPGSAVIRVYNLTPQTMNQIQTEFTVVTLQAGYQNGPFAAIFVGTLKQFRKGKENPTTVFLDLLCADWDFMNIGTAMNVSIGKGSTPSQAIALMIAAANNVQSQVNPLSPALSLNPDTQQFLAKSGVSPYVRGKVLYGSSSRIMRSTASSLNASWSIQKGVLQVIPFDGYLESEAVVLSQSSGVVGIPTVTNEGIEIKCLMNPLLHVGGTVKLDNALVNQFTAALGNIISNASGSKGLPFNSLGRNTAQPDFYATVGVGDGLYRILVAEYDGDTRGGPWYTNLKCLLIDQSTQTVSTNPTGQ